MLEDITQSSLITTLDEAKNWLAGKVKLNEEALIGKSTFSSYMLDKTLAALDITEMKITVNSVDTDNVTLNGNMTVLGFQDASVTICFNQSNDNLIIEFSVDFGEETKWSFVPGIDFFLSRPKLLIKPDEDNGVISSVMEGTFLAGDIQIPAKLDIPSYKGEWLLSLDGNNNEVALNSESFEALAGNQDLINILPNELIQWEKLSIEDVKIGFNPILESCSLIALNINYSGDWKFFDGAFEIASIKLNLKVYDLKVEGKKVSLEGELHGELKFDDASSIDVGGMFPSKTVYARLDEGKSLSLSAIFKKFDIYLPEEFLDLNVSEFEFMFFTENSDYSFNININTNDSSISIFEGKLKLEALDISIDSQHESSEEIANVSGCFNTSLKIQDTEVFLSAEYKGKDEGINLIGKSENINIGQLIAYIGETFGITDIPDFIKDIVLTNLEINYSTKTKNITFNCNGEINISSSIIDIEVKIEINHEAETKTCTKEITGSLNITNDNSIYKFEIDFQTLKQNTSIEKEQDTATYFVASYSGDDIDISIKDILASILSKEVLALIPNGFSIGLKGAYFAIVKDASINKSSFIFDIDLPKESIDLSDIPILGGKGAPMPSIEDLRLLFVSSDIKKNQVEEINKIIPTNCISIPENTEILKSDILKRNFYITATLNVDENKKELNFVPSLQQESDENSQEPLKLKEASDDLPHNNIYWFDIEKTLGPIYFAKIGISYEDSKLAVIVDSSLKSSFINVHLDGFSVSTSLSEFKPDFSIDGLSISYTSEGYEISGGFLKDHSSEIESYSGEVILKTPAFSLTGLGCYSYFNNNPSLFAFLMLGVPLGGPPCFFVTGLAGGFGYNRKLNLPSIDTVKEFSLVQAVINPPDNNPFKGEGGTESNLLDILSKMSDDIPIEIGENWIAAGIKFTSFEIMESFALLTVEFGKQLEVALMGFSTISFPEDSQPQHKLINADLALAVKYLPDIGEFSAEAKLMPDSYLFTNDCHLTGGFAYYMWFDKNPHSGDFVLTLGGYHPQFVIPDHYPKVPRLGFNWNISENLYIKGGLYFALTPTCIMSGGNMEAVWQSGGFKAWFTMEANFLISWKPYYYEANMDVSFGVSYTFNLDLYFFSITKTISVSLGAALNIWGPDFSGVAEINLYIISFKIAFGSGEKRENPSISWDEFKQSFLPDNPDSICSINIQNGLVKDLSKQKDIDEEIDWIVNSESLCIITNTVIPAKDYSVKLGDGTSTTYEENNGEWTKDFGIYPVKVKPDDFNSKHSITLISTETLTDYELKVEPILGNSPKALWGDSSKNEQLSNDSIIKETIVGLKITANPSDVNNATMPIDRTVISTDYENYKDNGNIYWSKPIIPKNTEASTGDYEKDIEILKSTINSSKISRDSIVEELKINYGFILNDKFDLKDISEDANEYFFGVPILNSLGEEK